MGNASSQPTPEQLSEPNKLWVDQEADPKTESRPSDIKSSPTATEAHNFESLQNLNDLDGQTDALERVIAEKRAARAAKRAAKAERKALRRLQREARQLQHEASAHISNASQADTLNSGDLDTLFLHSPEDSPMGPRKNRNKGATPSAPKLQGTFGIDPALEQLRHDGHASAERSTANMVAPMANMGGALIPGQARENGEAPPKKKRGRKSNKERLEAQQRAAAAEALASANDTEVTDLGPRLLTELAAAAVADEEQQQQLAQLRASLTEELAEAPTKKRKRQEAADEEEHAEENGTGKKKKKKTQYAKRTDGVASQSQSPEPDSTQSFPESGTFTRAELKALDTFMEDWKNDHEIGHSELADIIQSKHRGADEGEGGFWAQVFDVLPRRKDRRSVRLTCRRRYHNFERRGKWEAEDDEMLKNAWAKTPNKWTQIGETINRMPEDCKDRYQNYLACGDNRRVGDWTEKEEMALAVAVEECKQQVRKEAKALAEQRGQTFFDDKDWMSLISFKTVSQKMGLQRSGLQCRQHWKRMQTKEDRRANPSSDKKKKTWRDAQAADNYKRMLTGDKYEILLLILRSDTSTEENIPWKLLTRENRDSKWTTKDRKVAFERMKKLVPPQPTLADELSTLIDYFQRHHADELFLHYSGPVRAQDAPRKAYSRPVDADETPAARIRKGLKSKGTHKSSQNVTASDDENIEASHDAVAIDPALEYAEAQGALTDTQEIHDKRGGAVKKRKAKTGTDVLQNAKAVSRKARKAATPVDTNASWFALPGDDGL